jgi:peptide-methionine (S)-S-oxide reductase
MLFRKSVAMVASSDALPGRSEAMRIPSSHYVNGASLTGPWSAGVETLVVGMGCFWGAERKFWQSPGVVSTSVGYAGGYTPNPTYEEVCSGLTGHTEVVMVAFDTNLTTLDAVLRVFWENHDPTQGMRQGNDVGTQYRSAIYFVSDAQHQAATQSRANFQVELTKAEYGDITTEIAPLREYFYAEEYHQQYLAKNPNGYCGLGGTGVSCPVGVAR